MNNSNTEQEGSLLNFFTGIVIGGALGTIAGMLLAPKAGIETRHQLSENVSDTQNKAKQLFEGAKSSLTQGVDSASKNIEVTVNRVVESFNAGSKAAQESIKDQTIAKNDKSDRIVDVKLENNNVDISNKANEKVDVSKSNEVKNERFDG